MSQPSLTPEQFARVRAIFEAAIDRPPSERHAYAAGACAGDAELLHEVERMLAAEDFTNTLLPRDAQTSSASATHEGRFPAGTILGERYRVLGLLGHGGMGEVYRAFDLKLDQVVALKFLPPTANNSARLLERFRGEVRIARQVSHRNVCRVHDIGEADGLAFLSMEYIDGDNLASLLAQIGRLPADKALEFARRLCAGLAAAHEKGVLHRDLKPANIMIDRRGQLLITDFGLAAVADAVPGADIRSGTPAYMSPEQKAGKEVTIRSDIYSLGLVLAEMFTGKRDTKTSATKDFDPAIERVIERCLDPDPARRPESAITVARMLPGGDPLAEALAAGETPTPGMVAESNDTATLSIRWSVACLIFIILALCTAPYLGGKASIVGKTAFPYPPSLLAQKGRDLAHRLGYTEKPLDETFRYFPDVRRLWAVETLPPEAYRAQLAAAQPGEVNFILQQRFSDNRTPLTGVFAYADTLSLVLDPPGRLVSIYASPAVGVDSPANAKPVDWSAVQEAAGLDPAQWTPVEPVLSPAVRFDERRAWIGRYPHIPGEIRYEAAAWRGRIVFFHRQGPWLTEPLKTEAAPWQRWLARGLSWTFSLAIIAFAVHTYITGRADSRSAARVFGFVALTRVLAISLNLHDPVSFLQVSVEPALVAGINAGVMFGIATGAAYFGLEPFARRHWPQLLISWTRILRGDMRSGLVGAHALVGMALGSGLGILLHFIGIYSIRPSTPALYEAQMRSLTISGFGSTLLEQAGNSVQLPLALLFSIVLWRLLLRSTWLAGVVTLVIISFLAAGGSPSPGPIYAASFAQFGLMILILVRFGVLPVVVGGFVSEVLNRFPLTSDVSAWYAIYGVLPLLLIFGMALWSFRTALGGRKLFREGITR